MALYATNRFAGDGTTTQYEISFVGTYISRSHVFAYQLDTSTGNRVEVPIQPHQWLNDHTITGMPVTPVGQTLFIYRSTPKPPEVDFVNGSRLTEHNLDLVAKQGLFVAAEAMDAGTLALEAAASVGGDATDALALAGEAMTQAAAAVAAANAATSTAASAFSVASSASVSAGQAALQAGNALTVANDAQATADHAVALVGAAVAGSVVSFNGRTGTVLPQAGDYTKAQVGLGNVDNTSDADKPVSIAQAAAITAAQAGKQDTLVSGTNIKTINGSSILGSGNLTISGGGAGGDMFKADYDSNNDGSVDAADTVPWAGVSGKPGNATTSTSGFMSGSDKAKLDSIASGATANSTDAALRDRATHTGTQAISTVVGLQGALDGKLAVGGTAVNATKWAGGTKYVSTSAPSGGADGDVWFERVA